MKIEYKVDKAAGFSLVELMVVIAIVGVLAAVAVPTYKNYVIRAKVVALMPVMESIKSQIISYYNSGGLYTNQVYKVIFETTDTNKPPGLYWLYIGYYGSVDMRLDGASMGLSADPWILLVPTVSSSGIVAWTCAYHVSMDVSLIRYLPSSCQQVISSGIGFSSSNGMSY